MKLPHDIIARLWAKDASLWKSGAEQAQAIIERLGWLEAPEKALREVERYRKFAGEARKSKVSHVVLLGMGGSSLCPEAFATTFGSAKGYPRLLVADSTDPGAIAALRAKVNLKKTWFIVSSKSGGTVETSSLFSYFRAEMEKTVGAAWPERFCAITDPGTQLDAQARSLRFRAVFAGPPDVGGRYSALTAFGLVPAALLGINLGKLINAALRMTQACRSSEINNPGLSLGAWMGEQATRGRDQLTLIVTPQIEPFAAWAEQLVAESLGKEGKGIVPVIGEELVFDRFDLSKRAFVYVRLGKGDAKQNRFVAKLKKAGAAIHARQVDSEYDIAAEMFCWMVATAVAAAALGVNPFDQPNVEEAKALARKMLDGGKIEAAFAAGDAAALIGQARPGEYVALLPYLSGAAKEMSLLRRLRSKIQAKRLATTLTLGPRYLHSTGQLHKGGIDEGRFLLLLSTASKDIGIPGGKFSFGQLEKAQAFGDLQALQQRGRRAAAVDLGKNPAKALARLIDTI